ncbi:Phosphohistidine phosphatase SixA [Polaromonas sp. CG9_12]|uniref:SixA phosphatase family protein n=1 Tax=Polaromonas sp. CG_9.11 TaxID=2787730 RepID=UPI0004DDC734|nr:histidine phosphatase family protein [Polaromonas sp. CG_9.11]MBG6076259.1 phosphohistidine phosphatase [Polaromonas sp. CG_9.11]CDS49337.1 Phosphohistidine phosphatase SixA [Polaromonas sp. CG9_12]
MDLVLWRHAEAQELPEGTADARSDLERKLTARGEKQAARMAEWLDRQLPGSARILASPARRCDQTALALGRKFKIRSELAPGATPEALLEVVQWPVARVPVLVIGHQPTLGQTVARLLGLVENDCAFKKGAVWWLRTRERNGQVQAVVVSVQSPDFL